MSTLRAELLMAKGLVAEMDSKDQATVAIAAERIRALIHQSPVAILAVAIVALEAQINPASFGLPE